MPRTVKKDAKKKEGVDETKDFKIEQLFGSKTRVRLLRLLLENSDRAYYVRELTRRIDAQLNSVRRELQNLVEIGIVDEVDGSILENETDSKEKGKNIKKKYYSANQNFSFFEELRGIMNKSAVMMNKPFVEKLQKNGSIDLLFLTGRFVEANEIKSDILIVGSVKSEVLEEAISEFEVDLGREINYTYMPSDEFRYRKEVKDRFLESLLNSDKVVLVNGFDEYI